jgi:histidinol dehydrogenase
MNHRIDQYNQNGVNDRMKIVQLTDETRADIQSRLLKRNPANYKEQQGAVDAILKDIRERGDEALFGYTEKFDHIHLTKDTIQVTEDEIREAYDLADPDLIDVIRKALVNIRNFHEKQVRQSWFTETSAGTILGQRITPLSRVGVYVPGGKAVYPSSVLMNIVPAKVAGVGEIIMTTPCGRDGRVNPAVLVAAKEAGADRIFKAGGAQAIAAMAYGTCCIPKVDKIVGPGNIFVALAKRAVYGNVSIDSVAGPSEILVLADETANPRFVAADLLSQAEHDELASAVLVTTSRSLAESVEKEIEGFLKVLERAEIIKKSLDQFGFMLIADTMDDAVDAVNQIASEHLEIVTANPFETMTKVKNAGAIFLGSYSSEPLGDYFAGPNHILPTNGTAKFFSPLSVDDFIKKSSVIHYSEEALRAVHQDIEKFAKCEGLTAHANSIAVRFEDEKPEETR